MSRRQQQFLRNVFRDRRWAETNPVWVLRQCLPTGTQVDLRELRAAAVALPDHVLAEVAPPGVSQDELAALRRKPPGVVGLLASEDGTQGFVAPLRAQRAEEWSTTTLPFAPEVIQDVLARLFRQRGLALARLQPHLFPFRIEDSFGRLSTGSSMTIAGLLAVLAGAATEPPAILAGAVAVVHLEPDGESLMPVEQIRLKLDAFRREFDRGALLVRAKDCPEAEAYDTFFQEVWPVESLAELARRLDDSALLAPFRELKPLDRHHYERALAWIRFLIERRSCCREALELLEELQRAALANDVPRPAQSQLEGLRMDAYRHQGRYDRALDAAHRRVQQLGRRPEWTSFDEQVRAAIVYAASLYDPHDFDAMEPILLPWFERVRAECRLITPEARTWLWNTLARGRVITGGDWEGPLRDSLRLQQHLDPFQIPRTRAYLMHGYLRYGREQQAAAILRRADPDSLDPRDCSRWMLRFLQAELARQRGEVWTASEVESQPLDRTHLAHPFGFYFQATARQPGRSLEDACGRFERAREFFLADVGADDERNIGVFLAGTMALARAGWQKDAAAWQEALRSLQRFTRHRSARGLARYYGTIWPHLTSGPSPEAAETLLRHVPFF